MVDALWIDNGSGPVRNPYLSDAAFQDGLDKLKADNVAALWQAAHDFEYAEINGTGVGLLVIGVQRSLPKSLAIMAWDQSIWNLYYQRKPLVTHQWDGSLMDFSSCGPMPHTIPELMAEVSLV